MRLDPLAEAVAYAATAHQGQKDKLGASYILHPLNVMLSVSDEAKRVAVLHDVVEDTYKGLLEVASDLGLSNAETTALALLTRPGEEDPERPTYREFIMLIVEAGGEAGELAREIKIADIRHNLGRLTPELRGLEERYLWALEVLTEASSGCSSTLDAQEADPVS